MNKLPQHRLINSRRRKCQCGNYFYPENHKIKHCSDFCKKRFARDWNKIRKEFNDANPQLCNGCGCWIGDGEFKRCLQCRVRGRIYQRKIAKRRKENEN